MTLPRSADEHLRKLQLDPELEALARRLYPSDDRDAEARARAETERTAKAQEIQRNREALAQRCLDGEFGKDAKAAATQVMAESGGHFTSMALNRISGVVREAQRQERQTRKHG